ncbi:MAG: hypothetical protein M5U26_20140 [Planctomycetota bacterium]|nr:hypothetical protein [Planctomycetota bacterium]
MRTIGLCVLLLVLARAHAYEERLRGTLEKTAKPGACAQLTDALNETYYVLKTTESENLCAPLYGQKVLLTGIVEKRVGDADYFLNLKAAEAYRPESDQEKPPARPNPGNTAPLPPPPTPPADPGEAKKTATPEQAKTE